MIRLAFAFASTCLAGTQLSGTLSAPERARILLAEDVVRFCSENRQLDVCRRGRGGLLAQADIAQPPAAVLVLASDGPRRSYALSELAALKSGPDAAKARAFLDALRRIGFPAGLFARLQEAGTRIAFYAPDRQSEDDRYALYDFRSKTIHLWTDSAEAAAAELAHAVSDLLEPDDAQACTGMMAIQDGELQSLWAGYILKVNRYLGVGSADERALVYPREYLVYMTRREVSSPNFWMGKDPILGQRGYLHPEAYWEEGVAWFFTRRARLLAQEPDLEAFIARRLAEAERSGMKERVGATPDMSRCFERRGGSAMGLPSAY